MNVDAAPQREVDGAGRDESVRVAVIERKTRRLRQVGEGVERERHSGGYRARADVAALQDACRFLAERLDVEAVGHAAWTMPGCEPFSASRIGSVSKDAKHAVGVMITSRVQRIAPPPRRRGTVPALC